MTGESVRRGPKSEAAFRTISEVAAELAVPPHVLRFWETRFPAIQPLKRGGGRRYYRPEDIALLRAIRDRLYADGFTIKGVRKLLAEKGPAGLVATVAPAAPESVAEAPAVPAAAHEPDLLPLDLPRVAVRLSPRQAAEVKAAISQLGKAKIRLDQALADIEGERVQD